jgi:hypothetical protein
MYEKMPQHSQADMQSAVQAKIQATRAYDQQRSGMLGSAAGAAMLGSIPRDKPMLDVEYDQLEQAALELDQSVQWLIQRIQPICQPSTAGKAIEGNSCVEPASPSSEMRTKLKNLRGLVESISSRIAEVRYTIEV